MSERERTPRNALHLAPAALNWAKLTAHRLVKYWGREAKALTRLLEDQHQRLVRHAIRTDEFLADLFRRLSIDAVYQHCRGLPATHRHQRLVRGISQRLATATRARAADATSSAARWALIRASYDPIATCPHSPSEQGGRNSRPRYTPDQNPLPPPFPFRPLF